ncbi:MAG: hypothetical protein KME16_27440 [Scytolyngbya sp. HA4215-MV1]|nr:hypothetical protein [Scytolyngbya sp. HA4215-MV1]
MKKIKPTIGTRLESDELEQIDRICEELGESRSSWLYNLIRESIGSGTVATVKSLSHRVAVLERKLSRLSG